MIGIKSLYFLYASLIGFLVLKFAFPTMLEVIGFETFLFFDAMLTLMVLTSWVGYLEGVREGYDTGLFEGYRKAFGND